MRTLLLVSHIPFTRSENRHDTVIDGLWARDLTGLAASAGMRIRVAAPEINPRQGLQTWGPTADTVGLQSGITFIGFPYLSSRRDIWRWYAIRKVLAREVAAADLIQTSNVFPPYVGLSFAHDLATRLGKKTLFVVAEDFYDMLLWEWVRTGRGALQRWRRHRQLEALDARVRRTAATASLTFLHTPAAVDRYRAVAQQAFAIRQPGHETEDVIPDSAFAAKKTEIETGAPLAVIAACRHKPLKGLDFLIRAGALLKERRVPFTLRLYGGGESTAELQALTRRYAIEQLVEFPGALPPGTEIYRAIAAGHVFAMPHRTTDFGRAFYDAMAGGTPVVAFRTTASVDTLREGIDGLACPLDDAESLASTLQRLHDDRELLAKLAAGARRRAITETRSTWYRLRAERIAELF